MVKSGVSLALMMGCALQVAKADDFSLGLTAGWSTKLYKGVNENKNNLIFPTIDYDADRFWFHGLSAGYDLLQTPADRISVLGYYLPLSLKASDSHSRAVRNLNNRRSTLMNHLARAHLRQRLRQIHWIKVTDCTGTAHGRIRCNWVF